MRGARAYKRVRETVEAISSVAIRRPRRMIGTALSPGAARVVAALRGPGDF